MLARAGPGSLSCSDDIPTPLFPYFQVNRERTVVVRGHPEDIPGFPSLVAPHPAADLSRRRRDERLFTADGLHSKFLVQIVVVLVGLFLPC